MDTPDYIRECAVISSILRLKHFVAVLQRRVNGAL